MPFKRIENTRKKKYFEPVPAVDHNFLAPSIESQKVSFTLFTLRLLKDAQFYLDFKSKNAMSGYLEIFPLAYDSYFGITF
jgi:hypothetical protein